MKRGKGGNEGAKKMIKGPFITENSDRININQFKMCCSNRLLALTAAFHYQILKMSSF